MTVLDTYDWTRHDADLSTCIPAPGVQLTVRRSPTLNRERPWLWRVSFFNGRNTGMWQRPRGAAGFAHTESEAKREAERAW